MENIIQLKISLQGVKPIIWRRIQVEKEITLLDLHHVLQIAMGWSNCHLFEFRAYRYKIGLIDDSFESETGTIDAGTVALETIIMEAGDKFEYTYDFGDSWEHLVEVEKIMTGLSKTKYPFCLDGENSCPPEDCGGSSGYMNMLEILKDKKHLDYKDTLRWVGRKFNPGHFNKDKVNKELSELDKYIRDWNQD